MSCYWETLCRCQSLRQEFPPRTRSKRGQHGGERPECQGSAAGLGDSACSSSDRLIKHILSYTRFIKVFPYYGYLSDFVFHNCFFFFFFKLPRFSGTFPGVTALTIQDWEQILTFNGRIGVLRVSAKMSNVILIFPKNVNY